jgi:outer membrane protein assembly factor BamE (lipoprotein component of BamABCDE complex)
VHDRDNLTVRTLVILALGLSLAAAGCGVAYQAGTELRAKHMRDSLKVGESMPEVRNRFGEPDIRTDTDSGGQVWSYASRANSNDIAATLFYTSAKEGDRGHFLDLKFVDGKLVSWEDAERTMPAKRGTGINYGFTAGSGGQPVSHF